MKHLDFQEYGTLVEDNDGDRHPSVVTAAVVGDEHLHITDANGTISAREVMTPTGARRVQKGDVFVETDRPGVYDYMTADQWEAVGYKSEAELDQRLDELDAEDDELSDSESDESEPVTEPVVEPVPAKKATARKRSLPSDENA